MIHSYVCCGVEAFHLIAASLELSLRRGATWILIFQKEVLLAPSTQKASKQQDKQPSSSYDRTPNHAYFSGPRVETSLCNIGVTFPVFVQLAIFLPLFT